VAAVVAAAIVLEMVAVEVAVAVVAVGTETEKQQCPNHLAMLAMLAVEGTGTDTDDHHRGVRR